MVITLNSKYVRLVEKIIQLFGKIGLLKIIKIPRVIGRHKHLRRRYMKENMYKENSLKNMKTRNIRVVCMWGRGG